MVNTVVNFTGSNVGTALTSILNADDIEIGTDPSYHLCKLIYLFHPLGQKMAESPIKMAQAQPREISVPKSPGDRVVRAFLEEWQNINADRYIFNICRIARIYGIASMAILIEGKPTEEPLDYKSLYNANIGFNIYDPLNSAGSLVLNQNPMDINFQKVQGLAVDGHKFHRSRFVVVLNEEPIYISYTSSAFGFVGRSVYQRSLFPLKSFLQTMVTDDLVSVKAGVVVAMMEQAGSIIDNVMLRMFGYKRQILKEAKVGNVISIGLNEKVETLNFRNMDGPYNSSRENILKNIATAADMPAKLLENETFVEGFGEGTEDAKAIAAYIDGIRAWMQPSYEFFTKIVQYRAWNPKFYETIQNEFPEDYKNKSYNEAFYEWVNSFAAQWPSLLKEPPSKQVEVDRTRLETVVNMLEVLLPTVDPKNKAKAIEWAADNINDLENLFTNPLELDYKEIEKFKPDPMMAGAGGGKQPGQKIPKPKTSMGELYRRHTHSEEGDGEVSGIIEDLRNIRDSMLRERTSVTIADSRPPTNVAVEAPNIHVAAPDINVSMPDINMPDIKQPVINVTMPPINLYMSEKVAETRRFKFVKSDSGEISGEIVDGAAVTEVKDKP